MEGGSGPRSGVHNKQMFIIGGFTISDPDCILDYLRASKKLERTRTSKLKGARSCLLLVTAMY